MKIKKTVILLSVLMLFLLIAGASANDINTTDQISVDENVDMESSTVGHDVMGEDSDKGTFTDLNNLIENSDTEIKLEKDYVYDNTTDSDFFTNHFHNHVRTNGIVISKSLTIDGQGHKIDAKHYTNIFEIESNSLILKNIIFLNGNNTDSGGSLRCYSSSNNLTIINCSFINNIAKENGGAIYGNCNIFNSMFIKNIAGDHGGAIYGTCSIVNSTFNNNSAGWAGIIYSENNVYVTKSSFNNNSDKGSGSALIKSVKDISIINSTFNNNYCDDGVIGSQGNVFIFNSNFNHNRGYRSAVILASENKTTIVDCNFTNNYAKDYGAILSSDIQVINSTFFNNSAKGGDGGAVYAINSGSIINSTFINNFARERGGAICGRVDEILNSTFINNINLDVFYRNDNYTMGNPKINKNNIFKNNDTYYNLFTNATKDNGVVNLNGDYVASQTIFITGDNVVINGNGHTIDAKSQYRIFYISGNNVTIKNITLQNGNCLRYGGGAIFYENGCYGDIINAVFINNTGGAMGGAIFYYDVKVVNFKSNIINSILINNTYDDSYYPNQKFISGLNFNIVNSTIIEYGKDVTEKYLSKDTIDNKGNNNNDISKVKTKKATKITAKNKTFKAKTKTKKYTITLKAGKNAVKKVRVYLKIKGKTYKATTNNKGKATFKIKLKKKGTFNTKITFNDNKSYKASSKTIKIKIK